MNNRTFFSLILAISILIVHVGGASAAPALQDSPVISGKVHRITLDTDSNTGLAIVIVELVGRGQGKQLVRISQETALALGLLGLDSDGKPVINELMLGMTIAIEQVEVLPSPEEKRHPIGDALATFFFEGLGTDNKAVYDAIMKAHTDGVGFGLIAQALWLTDALPGSSLEDFDAILMAKETNVYTAFLLADGTTPKNWAQLRDAILGGEKIKKLGPVMNASNDNGNNGNQDQIKENNKDKDNEKNSGNNPGEDKGKDKEKEKE